MYCFDIGKYTQELYDDWIDPRKRALAGKLGGKGGIGSGMGNAKVYIAGKITGDPGYREKFSDAARELRGAGMTVLNPAILPDGFSYEAYMRMSGAMLAECDAICFLPDWMESRGSLMEAAYAAEHRIRVFMYGDWKRAAGKLAGGA